MLANQLALKYAQAVFELAEEQNMLDETQKQLTMVEETISGHDELATLLYHPRVPAEAKKETISKLFDTEIADFVYKFLLLLVDKRREPLLPSIVREFVKLANQARNIDEAEVTTAVPLSEDQQAALAAKLSAVTGKKMILKTAVDKKLLGGVVVKIGDKLLDGSVARQLQVLQNALLKTEVTKIGVTN
jgi:F-type H+-transporting ATPase subunit delta